VSHTLYAHDGQNLFDPDAPFGGWRLSEVAPAGMMIVGIDNTGVGRIDEYTHVVDFRWAPGETEPREMGGGAAGYAEYLQTVVRPLIRSAYGEGARVGVMGSSLGGLVSLYIAHAYPGEYAMAISLSGVVHWGRIGRMNDSLFQLYATEGVRDTAIYVDTSGNGIANDTANNLDAYCENRQFADQLAAQGYTWASDLWHWHEPGAPHNEAAWAARVARPLGYFAAR
jgi:predicted alpha/beta superfamily hydrolase